MDREIMFDKLIMQTADESRLRREAGYIQHGDTSCLMHSIAVAYYSYAAARRLRLLRFRDSELIRGALLHDYFLYDWHTPDGTHPLHGFSHPAAALVNAREDFKLSPVEEDIIREHMFPLTPLAPPTCKESLLVCVVDKICSLRETFLKRPYKNRGLLSIFARVADGA